MEKEGERKFTVEKLNSYYLSQVLKANVSRRSHVDSTCACYAMKMTHYLCGLAPNYL